MRRDSIAAALLALGAAWLAPPASQAMSLQPINLADMVQHSTHIVAGTVSAVNQGIDRSGLPYTEIELKVAEAIRGNAGGTLTFRQFGLQTAQPAANGRKYVGLVAGMPRYAQGDQVILFLGPVSTLGYRTTVGLGQGHFAMHGGNLRNDANNSGLFSGVSFGKHRLNDKEKFMVTTKQGVVGADTFVSLVRRAVSGKWWDGPKMKTPPHAPRPISPPPARIQTEGGPTND
jgi:hypothetical protein